MSTKGKEVEIVEMINELRAEEISSVEISNPAGSPSSTTTSAGPCDSPAVR